MRGTDYALLATCAALLVAGPVMALLEYERHLDAASLAEVTGEAPPVDVEFRAPWRAGVLLAVIAIGILGTLVALRVSWQPRVRAVSGRLLFLLLAGMSVLDLAFFADARWLAAAPHGVRAASVVWLYPVGAMLVAGAAMRLAEVEAAFAKPRAAGSAR